LSKVITSPVKRFSGTVVLSDPLTYPQVFAWEDTLEDSRTEEATKDVRRQIYSLLPGILACVEEWHLKGVPEHPTRDTFPATPNDPATELATWLVHSISELYEEADNVPLE
jgi:hypothetical protein